MGKDRRRGRRKREEEKVKDERTKRRRKRRIYKFLKVLLGDEEREKTITFTGIHFTGKGGLQNISEEIVFCFRIKRIRDSFNKRFF